MKLGAGAAACGKPPPAGPCGNATAGAALASGGTEQQAEHRLQRSAPVAPS